MAGAGDPQPLAVFDPGRDLDRLGPCRGCGRCRRTSQGVSGLAGAAADVAGDAADHLPERRPRDLAQLAGAAAALAGGDRRPRLGAVAVAVLAGADRVEATSRRPRGDLVELTRPRGCRRRRRTAAAEADARLPPKRLEDVVDRAEAGAGVEAAGAQALVPVGVVGAAPLGVGEDLVGLGRLLELLLRLGVVVVDVGVQFAGEAAEGLLDLGLAASRPTPSTS